MERGHQPGDIVFLRSKQAIFVEDLDYKGVPAVRLVHYDDDGGYLQEIFKIEEGRFVPIELIGGNSAEYGPFLQYALQLKEITGKPFMYEAIKLPRSKQPPITTQRVPPYRSMYSRRR